MSMNMNMMAQTMGQMAWSRQIAVPVCSSLKFICSSSVSVENKKPRKLILYSKPGCCLCDGLKEKLVVAFSPTDVDLQIRDITTNPDWERVYQYEIPVLAKLTADGTEVTLPRLSPRVGIEIIQKKIGNALKD